MPPNVKQSRITIQAQDTATAGPAVSINDKGHPRSPTLLGAGSPPPFLSNGSVRFHNTADLRNNQFASQSGVNSIRTKGAGEVPRQESAEKDGQDRSPDTPKSPLIEDVVDATTYAFRQANELIANDAEDLDVSKEMDPDAVRELLRFRISVNITAVIITFVTAVASSSESSVLTTAQLLWINITVMDTFAALALASDPAPASRDVLDRKPASSFNTVMRMQIIGQSMYQTFIILLCHFAGGITFGYDKSTHTELQIQQWYSELSTLVFITFVLSQIFNLINSRRIDTKKEMFAGILYIIIITLIEVAAQIVIALVGGVVFNLHHLGGKSWGISLALGFGPLPLGFLIRLIPEEPVERILRKLALMQDSDIPQVERSGNRDKGRNLSAFQTVKDDLAAFFHVGSDTT
ncbi:hypothetical protein FRC04_002756 [Tulasnella sp. 424]|nr:hypothetical protein FRC04_002756 [Tulasnella sp. 424]KAG8962089.1 hypothetical protein FRC05_005529 [Tulasnella sp. 425]